MYLILDFCYLVYIIIVLPYYLFRFITNRIACSERSRTTRLGLSQRFGFLPPRLSNKPAIWLHGASVGEILTLQPLINQLTRNYPDAEIILSVLTPTAYQLAREKFNDSRLIFWPIDLSFIVRKVLKRLKPNLIVLMEQEIWPNFINQADKLQIPLTLINGRLTEKSLARYRLIDFIIKPTLQKIRLIAVQTEEYAARYRTLGVDGQKIAVTGNMKYDIKPAEENTENYFKLFGLKPADLVIVSGSTHHPEEEILIDAYCHLKSEICNLKLILAPRHPEEDIPRIEKYCRVKNLGYIKRSQLPVTDALEQKVIIIDTLGELKKIYSVATVVFIGGSLVSQGGQNVLEPAAAGKPIIFGPSMYNFREPAELLLSTGAARQIKNPDELTSQLKSALTDTGWLKQAGPTALNTICPHQGATNRNLEILKKIIP